LVAIVLMTVGLAVCVTAGAVTETVGPATVLVTVFVFVLDELPVADDPMIMPTMPAVAASTHARRYHAVFRGAAEGTAGGG
jgi:hypothetical protein